MPLLKVRKSYQRLGDDKEDSDATKGFTEFNSGLSNRFAKVSLRYKLPGISTKASCDLKIDQKLHKNVEGTTTQLIDQFQEKIDLESASYVSMFSCDNVNNTNNKVTTNIEPSDNLTENIYASINEDIYSTINDSIGSSEDYVHDDENNAVNDSTEKLNTKKSVVYQISSEDDEDSGTERYGKVGSIVSSEFRIDKRRFLTRSMFDLKTDNNAINKETNDEPSNIKYTDEGIYSTISESVENSEDDHYETVDDVFSSTWVYETIALLDNVMKGGHKEAEHSGTESKLSTKTKSDFPSSKRYKLDSRSSRLSTSCFDLRSPNISNIMSVKGSQKCHKSGPFIVENTIPSNLCSTSVPKGSVLDINFESPIINLKNNSYLNIEERAPPLPLKENSRYDKLFDESSDFLLGYSQNSLGTLYEDQDKQPMDTSLYQTPIAIDVHKAQGSHEILRDLRHGLMKSERPLRESAIFYTKAQPYPGNHSPGADTKKL